jgi:hypothetical protein
MSKSVFAVMTAAVAAVFAASCEQGATSPDAMESESSVRFSVHGASGHEAVTIETLIDFTIFGGTFDVTAGSAELGCNSGNFFDLPAAAALAPSAIRKNFTCTSGGSGTFTVMFNTRPRRPGPGPFGNGTWSVWKGTGDFANLHGAGDFSLMDVDFGALTGVEMLTGHIFFAP